MYYKEDKYKHVPKPEEALGDHMDILCRKGFYLDEWVDGSEQLDHEGIQPLEASHSQFKLRTVDMVMMIRLNKKQITTCQREARALPPSL